MEPCPFPEQNVVYAKDQEEYRDLPAHRTADGRVISCWRLTWWERVQLVIRGRLWLSVLTFSGPLQPQLPQIDTPFDRSPAARDEGRVTR